MTIRVAITGIGIEAPVLPGVTKVSDLIGQSDSYSWCFDPAVKLGKKGLRYKEPATLLGLCAARAALLDSGWLTEGAATTKLDNNNFGVAIASNTGNLDTVCAVADKIRAEHVNATSPMDLPNASSNVIASTIAIRFGLRAMNLMITSGASASADALVLAYSAIRSGRVTSMLVGAVEVDSEAVRSLQAGGRLSAQAAASAASVIPAATTLILESEASAKQRNARIYGYVEDYEFSGSGKRATERFLNFVQRKPDALLCLDAEQIADQLAAFPGAEMAANAPTVNLTHSIGQLYGGLAVAQMAYACEEFAAGRASEALLVSGGALGDKRLTALSVARA